MTSIMDLEVRLAYQEHLLAELDGTIRSLRDEVDRLRSDLQRATEEVSAMRMAVEDAPPPHY